MSSISNPSTVRNTATCPHGLPMGACPICNGGAGGKEKETRENGLTQNVLQLAHK